MSRSDWDDEDDQDAQNPDLVKDLRKQLKGKDSELKTATDELSKLRAAERKRSLSEVLKSKGVNEKVSAFYPADAETTDEAVAAWVTEHADVFGIKLAENTQEPAVDEQVVSGLKAIVGADTGSADPNAAGLLTQVQNASTFEELQALVMAGR